MIQLKKKYLTPGARVAWTHDGRVVEGVEVCELHVGGGHFVGGWAVRGGIDRYVYNIYIIIYYIYNQYILSIINVYFRVSV